jgi:hypothetical protein
MRGLIKHLSVADEMLRGVVPVDIAPLHHKVATAYVTAPRELMSYFVHLDYSTVAGNDRHYGVFLPHFGPRAEEIYTVLREHQSQPRKPLSVSVEVMDMADSLMPDKPNHWDAG